MTFPTPQEIAESYNKRWEALKEEAKLIIAAAMVESYAEKEYPNGTRFKGGHFTLHPRYFVIRGWIVQKFAEAGWAVKTGEIYTNKDGEEFFAVSFENRQVA